MKHWHIGLCLLFIAGAIVLVVAGAGSLAFLPAIGCALMMGAMVWMMVRMGSGSRH
jgi:hypothetical protein